MIPGRVVFGPFRPWERVKLMAAHRLARPLAHDASFALAWEMVHEPWHWDLRLSLPLFVFGGMWAVVVAVWEK